MQTEIHKGYVETSEGQIHYRMLGKPSSQLPIVFLHQTSSSSVMYEALMRELQNDFSTLAFDTPGFGNSFFPSGKPTVPYYARIIQEALKALEVKQCFLFGHHTGAAIAVEMAITSPTLVRQLALSGPSCLTPEERTARIEKIRPLKIDKDGNHLLFAWKRAKGKDDRWPLWLVHREAVLNLVAGERYHEGYLAVYENDLQSKLPKVQCETLVLAGELDMNRAAAEAAVRTLRQGVLQHIPNGDPYMCDLQAPPISEILQTFFRRG